MISGCIWKHRGWSDVQALTLPLSCQCGHSRPFPIGPCEPQTRKHTRSALSRVCGTWQLIARPGCEPRRASTASNRRGTRGPANYPFPSMGGTPCSRLHGEPTGSSSEAAGKGKTRPLTAPEEKHSGPATGHLSESIQLHLDKV